MSVWTLGLNHKSAPLALRERFAFATEQMEQSIHQLRGRFASHKEVAILSTCNRTEIYCAGDQSEVPQTLSWLAQEGGTDVTVLQEHTYCLTDDSSARHAFRVASGLDSMVLGEPQILGQMKDAVRVANEAGALGTTLNQLFQRSFSVAKEVRSKTEIGVHSISMAAAAVRLAARLFEDLSRVHVLFVGAGEMIELCVPHFAAKSPRSITIANRNEDKAQALVTAVGGNSMPLADIPRRLHEFDIVISCTASTLPLIGLGAVESALKHRRHRPMFMVDLAVPRDIEPEVKALGDVYLYTVDDLSEVVSQGQHQRQSAVVQAEIIIDDGVRKFMSWLDARSHVPLIQQLNSKAQGWREMELIRARRMIERGEDVDAVLQAMSVNLTKKMLNGPLRELNHLSAVQRSKAREAVCQFFLNSDLAGEDAPTRQNGAGEGYREVH
jgi:glutamyl-tRNA reductase